MSTFTKGSVKSHKGNIIIMTIILNASYDTHYKTLPYKNSKYWEIKFNYGT